MTLCFIRPAVMGESSTLIGLASRSRLTVATGRGTLTEVHVSERVLPRAITDRTGVYAARG